MAIATTVIGVFFRRKKIIRKQFLTACGFICFSNDTLLSSYPYGFYLEFVGCTKGNKTYIIRIEALNFLSCDPLVAYLWYDGMSAKGEAAT